ncbi:putative low-temperature-induced 65 kDa protein [Cocos nucifera]|uniref:Putative low-temperature-induced 65 kDa protein n=1 Tax=Cocos nucifera TaxID=13894 RepID=A0A8K0J059_COCNU|nr:putative low-temperature-induced 65 kDa protein [Cocos nucifera]
MSESEGRRHVESISAHHHGGFDFEDDHDHHHVKKSVLSRVKEKARKWRQLLAKKKHGHDDDNPTPPWGVTLDEEDDEQYPEYHGAPSGFDFEDDHDHHHVKKSVLSRVKEKARKWRQLLAKKKHGHDDDNPTPPWGDEEDDEQHPEYHGAPMYESETAPDTYKDGTSQHRSAVQSPRALEKSVVFQHDNANKEPEMKQGNDTLEQPVLHHLDAIKETSSPHATSLHDMPAHQDPVGESGTNKMVPVTVIDTMFSEATQMIASKIQSPGRGYELGAKQMWDKGISVKEYLMHKLEPGEEDRALCQVITEAVSPRNAGEAQGEAGMVEKKKFKLTEGDSKHTPIKRPWHTHTCHTLSKELEEIVA